MAFRSIFAICALGLGCHLPVVAAPFDDAVLRTADSITAALAKAGSRTVVVADIEDLSGGSTVAGRFLAEELSSRLVGRSAFTLVDRAAVLQVLRRENRTARDLDDPVVQDLIARSLNVTTMVKGTLVMAGGALRLNLKVVDLSSKSVIGAVLTDIPATESLSAMFQQPAAVSADRRPESGPSAAQPAPGQRAARTKLVAKPVEAHFRYSAVQVRIDVVGAEQTSCCTVLTLTATPVRSRPTTRDDIDESVFLTLVSAKASAYLVDERGDQKPFKSASGLPDGDPPDQARFLASHGWSPGRELAVGIPMRFSLEFEGRVDLNSPFHLAAKLASSTWRSRRPREAIEVNAAFRSIRLEEEGR